MSVTGISRVPSQRLMQFKESTPIRPAADTIMKLDSNTQKYITVISRLKDELVILQESQAMLLEDLHDYQDENFNLSQELHRCQRSNLNIVDELQACQTANTILRDELSKMESQKRHLTKRMEKYKDACRILKREVAHREIVEEQSRDFLQKIQRISTEALGGNNTDETRQAFDEITGLAADQQAIYDACPELGTTCRSNSTSSDSMSHASMFEESGVSSCASDMSSYRKDSIESDHSLTDSNNNNTLDSNEDVIIDSKIDGHLKCRPKSRGSYVIIHEENEETDEATQANAALPEIIIDTSACEKDFNNNSDTCVPGPIRMADYNPSLFDQTICKILLDTSGLNADTSIKGKRFLCACSTSNCIHAIHGEYEFITEKV